jgi:hypothetical protein
VVGVFPNMRNLYPKSLDTGYFMEFWSKMKKIICTMELKIIDIQTTFKNFSVERRAAYDLTQPSILLFRAILPKPKNFVLRDLCQPLSTAVRIAHKEGLSAVFCAKNSGVSPAYFSKPTCVR